jgi:hypothetical protein
MENNSIGAHTILRRILIEYIKALGASTMDEAFISLAMSLKIIDFVHFLNHRTGLTSDVSN